MTCPRCRVKMQEQKRRFHKQRKWVYPKGGRVPMQKQRPNRSLMRGGQSGLALLGKHFVRRYLEPVQQLRAGLFTWTGFDQ
jgi:hypothetical protein